MTIHLFWRRVPPIGLLAVLLLAGCCDVLVRRLEPLTFMEEALTRKDPAEELSPTTVQLLKERELFEVYRRSPADAEARLQKEGGEKPQPETLLALAEINYILARRAEKDDAGKAALHHYRSAGYAYHYLVRRPERSEGSETATDAEDPGTRRARELYNTGLAGWLRQVGYAGHRELSKAEKKAVQQVVGPLRGMGHSFAIVRHGFAWQSGEFGTLHFCADHRPAAPPGRGLGVPLICLRDSSSEESAGKTYRYPRDLSFPVTAFLGFDGSVAGLAGPPAGTLELYNPQTIRSVEMGGRVFPLEADLSTPLAYFRKHNEFDGVGDLGFLHPDKLRDRRGIYFFEPYQPGKVPVLLVHGLRSSPAAWLPLFQELQNDPLIRERYQFWFYLYPTGDMYLKAATDLRQSLARLREELDPQRSDPAWERMVVVGHSMGGIIARLLTVDSQDRFWSLVAHRKPGELHLSPESEAELCHMFFFEPLPEIRRVIFLATPHHGARLSASLPARLAQQFVHPPRVLQEAALELERGDRGREAERKMLSVLPSLDMIAPTSPFLAALAECPKPKGVAYHSILGDAPVIDGLLERVLTSGREGVSDGIVSRTSTRLEGSDSSKVVPADHAELRRHPETVGEVKRILREHLQ